MTFTYKITNQWTFASDPFLLMQSLMCGIEHRWKAASCTDINTSKLIRVLQT